MMKKIIVLSAPGNSGKDYIAQLLFSDYKRFAFADLLKKEVSTKYNLDISYFDRSLKDKPINKFGKSPRQLLIEHAAIMRRIDEFHYIFPIFDFAKTNDKIIVTDCRLKNEIDTLRVYFNNEFTLTHIWVSSPNAIKNDHCDLSANDCDFVIVNKFVAPK